MDLAFFAGQSPFLAALAASVVAGTLATAAGALPTLVVKGLSERSTNVLLAFAAGVMLFVIGGEVIPETHRAGFERGATASLFLGFSVMLFLDTALL